VNGKAEWLGYALPVEGERAPEQRVGAFAHSDVVTCGLDEPVGDVRERVERSPYGFGLVVSDDGVLLGRLRKSALEGDPARTAEAVMEAGPSTVRPDQAVDEIAKRLRDRDLKTAVVTTPDGKVVGVVVGRELARPG
jgi:CBS domain-containing protein